MTSFDANDDDGGGGKQVLLTRLSELRAAAAAIERGERGVRVSPEGADDVGELRALVEAFNAMAAAVDARSSQFDDGQNRVQEAASRFGRTLSATHDPDQLIRSIVDAVVEATCASGGVFVGDDGEMVRVGDPDAGSERIELPLQARHTRFGSLVVTGNDFDVEQRETAASLIAHAVIALENARLHRIVERQARIDELTGLANRRRCEDALATELSRAERFGSAVALVFADLDRFKDVNDRYGHAAGDDVLRDFARVLTGSVREIDLAGRWGGEEFVLILPGTDAAGGEKLAERVRSAFEARTILAPDGSRLSLTASFGVAAFPEAHGRDELVMTADEALYAAKRAGRNRVSVAPSPARRA